MRPLRRSTFRWIGLIGLSVLALGATACGGGDDDNGTDGSREDAQQARAMIQQFYGDLAAGNAAAICPQMLVVAQQQMAQTTVSKSGPENPTCQENINELLVLMKDNGAIRKLRNAKIGTAKVNGNTALVNVSFGANAGQISLTKADGEWKAGISSLAQPNQTRSR